MMTGALDLSIVIPVYNEEENLPSLWPEIREVLAQTGLVYEVIFVDDGSRGPERRDRPGIPRGGPARAAGAAQDQCGRDGGHRRRAQGRARPLRRHHGRGSPERPARHSGDALASRPVGRRHRLAGQPRRGRLAGAPDLLARRQPGAQRAQRRDHPGQRVHVPRLPPRVPAGPGPVQGLSSVHSHAPQDARLPRARGAREPSAPALRPSRSTGSATARARPSWTSWSSAG